MSHTNSVRVGPHGHEIPAHFFAVHVEHCRTPIEARAALATRILWATDTFGATSTQAHVARGLLHDFDQTDQTDQTEASV